MHRMVDVVEAYILFRVDRLTYALPSRQVQQVEMIEKITPVPNTPGFVEGVVFIRGQVMPVINVRARLGLENIPYTPGSRLVIVRLGSRTVALAVDSAREFIHVEGGQITPPPEDLAPPTLEYTTGVINRQEGQVLVIELAKLLHAEADRSLNR